MADIKSILDVDRRRFLKTGFSCLTACLSLPLWNLVSGCQRDSQDLPTEPLTVPLAMVPMGKRTRLENNGRPVELHRTEEGITARSLLCTHQGCKVRWFEDRQLYICPCHEGQFDSEGIVVYGMPSKPLLVLKVAIRDGQVVVG